MWILRIPVSTNQPNIRFRFPKVTWGFELSVHSYSWYNSITCLKPCAHHEEVCAYQKRCADNGLAHRCAHPLLSCPPRLPLFRPKFAFDCFGGMPSRGSDRAAPSRARQVRWIRRIAAICNHFRWPTIWPKFWPTNDLRTCVSCCNY